MFGEEPRTIKEPVDYTGLIIGAMLAPVFLLFAFLGKADMGLAACIVAAAAMVAIKLRWELRKHVWFWATIAFVLLLHIPLVLTIRRPPGGLPTLVYSMPLGILDFCIILGAIRFVEKFIVKSTRAEDQ